MNDINFIDEVFKGNNSETLKNLLPIINEKIFDKEGKPCVLSLITEDTMDNHKNCKFQETRNNLYKCLCAIRNEQTLCREEIEAARSMFAYFLEFCLGNDIIKSYDDEAADNLINICVSENDEY